MKLLNFLLYLNIIAFVCGCIIYINTHNGWVLIVTILNLLAAVINYSMSLIDMFED